MPMAVQVYSTSWNDLGSTDSPAHAVATRSHPVRPVPAAHFDSGLRPDFFEPTLLRRQLAYLVIEFVDLLFMRFGLLADFAFATE
jgi:hypothetical protein